MWGFHQQCMKNNFSQSHYYYTFLGLALPLPARDYIPPCAVNTPSSYSGGSAWVCRLDLEADTVL